MKTRKKLVFSLLLTLIVALSSAHEFWLQPRKYRLAIGEELEFSFKVGENFDGEDWDLKKHKVEKIELHRAANTIDLKKLVKPDGKDRVTLKMDEEGTQLITMQTNYAFIELGAEKFNAYLKEDGLDNITALRTKSGTTEKSAKEFYGRFVKLLVQVGNKKTDTFKKIVGTPIEIIPLQNPYTLKSGDYLECRVLFNGKPLIDQMVKVWNKINTTTFLQNMYTEREGIIKFPLSSSGPWMVSTVKMTESQLPGADYQSMWSSLVFEIQ
ncbi:MAG: DUF4198 domain-containing protein [Cytophagales bacterium]